MLRILVTMLLASCAASGAQPPSSTPDPEASAEGAEAPAVAGTMKAFWNDRGRGPGGDAAVPVDLPRALSIWKDQVRGTKDNFLGLVDDQDRTIQFYFAEDIPEDAEGSDDLSIVDVDLPIPPRKGSYVARVTVAEVERLIEKAFRVGADPAAYDVAFEAW